MPTKICPQCRDSVGPRTKLCKCGHVFVIKNAKPKAAPAPAPSTTTAPPTATPETAPEIICISDGAALTQFVKQVKEAAAASRNTGGLYSAFLHHDHGTLQVEVYFPMRARE